MLIPPGVNSVVQETHPIDFMAGPRFIAPSAHLDNGNSSYKSLPILSIDIIYGIRIIIYTTSYGTGVPHEYTHLNNTTISIILTQKQHIIIILITIKYIVIILLIMDIN